MDNYLREILRTCTAAKIHQLQGMRNSQQDILVNLKASRALMVINDVKINRLVDAAYSVDKDENPTFIPELEYYYTYASLGDYYYYLRLIEKLAILIILSSYYATYMYPIAIGIYPIHLGVLETFAHGRYTCVLS